jgi:hypothetical protein
MAQANDERSIAAFAAIKTILEVLVGKEIVPAVDLAALLRDQSQQCSNDQQIHAAGILANLASFAADPTRASGRRLLNEPPLGSA